MASRRRTKAAEAAIEYQPVAGEFVHEADRRAEVPGYGNGAAIDPAIAQDVVSQQIEAVAAATQMPDDKPAYVPKLITSDPIGVELREDELRGKYRIMLSPDMTAEDFKDMMTKVKPILQKEHQLAGEHGSRTATFHFGNDGYTDWSIQYRYIRRDDKGEPVLKADGKTREYDWHRHQVDRIALDTYKQVVSAVKQRLGVEKAAEIDF